MKLFSSFLLRGGPVAGLVLLLVLLVGPAARAQLVPIWQSAMVVGGSNSNLAIKTTATNAGGDLYVAGGFSGIVTIGNTTLISIGGTDGFLAKWSQATDTFVWAYRFGGTDVDQVTALALNGNRVYLAGTFFSPTASFGAINVPNYGGQSFIGTDAFVAKLTDAGPTASFDWAQHLGGLGQDAATTLVATGTSVYVGGNFASTTATFGGISLTNSTAGAAVTYPDGFVAKLVDAGTSSTMSWVQPITGPGTKAVNALALNGASVYATGSFGGATATFGGSVLPNASTTANAYVAKLVDTGTGSSWQWALRAGGLSRDVGNALAVSGGRVYVAGSFSSAVLTLGPLTIANTGPSGITTDAFVAAVTDAGSTAAWTWAQQAGGTANDQGTALTACGAGGVYLAGAFASAAVTIGTTALPTASGGALVARLADTGTGATVAWAQRGGAASNTDASCLAVAGARLYMAGNFQNTATFGSLTLASSPLGAATNFLAFLTDPTFGATVTATAPALSGTAFALYPNPARSATTIMLPALPGTATATLTLRDALGRALRTDQVSLPAAGLHHELSLSGLSAGLYVLQVQAGETTASRRLVVE
ncbi:T9SS type A sorting domain-containing protein [Hymenobacter terricola]|uniref:T9SS type A sorting domain-containing protein n=1 Tax=Hymenobacter terricola TaxID=2819236 RepID=UPI001B301669|nr:T9SS type A sorting domain-containing protein [Hymenobacter terricola]